MFPGRYFPLTYYPTRYFVKVGSGAAVSVRAYAVSSFALSGDARADISLTTYAVASEE